MADRSVAQDSFGAVSDGARPQPHVGEPRVDVIVLGRNRAGETIAALRAVSASSYPNVRLVVVDNGSDNGADVTVLQAMRRLHPATVVLDYIADRSNAAGNRGGDTGVAAVREAPAVFVRAGRNRGYAGGMNVGLHLLLRAGPSPFFWLLHDDVVVEPDALRALVDHCCADRSIGLCGCLQTVLAEAAGADDAPDTVCSVVAGGFRYWPALGFAKLIDGADPAVAQRRVERRLYGVHGAAVFGTRSMLERAGLMGSDRHRYFEEQDWALRARRAGLRVSWTPRARVSHRSGVALVTAGQRRAAAEFDTGARLAGGGPDRAVGAYLMARARLAFTVKQYPWAVPSVLAAQTLRSLLDLRRGDRWAAWRSAQGAFDGLLRRHRRFGSLAGALLPGDEDHPGRFVLRDDGDDAYRVESATDVPMASTVAK